MVIPYEKKKPPFMPDTGCGIIILAAGSSSRLGTSKQLLMFNNKTLLQHTIEEAKTSGNRNIMVVTGANHDNIISSLSNSNVHFVYNENWQQGMASSIVAGLSAILSIQPNLSSVIVMVCDQPFVSSQLIKDIVTEKETSGKGIVACLYNETIGVPALFSQHYFKALSLLKGTEGAKKLITIHKDDVDLIPFPLGAVDIDTMEDYSRLIQ